ncbi:MAG TPA: TonB family protein [Pyrinomonadaceae bacterium]|nr:TonB family protein [Pyrinomonadaceae bacterium]
MFTNLIESSSHAKEFKRRGSFLLFTTATYVVLFIVTGVVSIYAYDARLEQQNLELVGLVAPVEWVKPEPQPVAQPDRPQTTRDNNQSNVTERAEAMVSVNRPELPPENISVTPNKNPPIPDRGLYAITGRNVEAAGPPPGPGTPVPGGQVVPPRQVVIDEPPPAPEPPKVPPVVSKGVITGQATTLPQPAYPAMAKQIRLQGKVSVQVLIDEQGRVISANAIDGHPLLAPAAQRAALQARFKPTLLSGQPVKVSGVITYDFKLGL